MEALWIWDFGSSWWCGKVIGQDVKWGWRTNGYIWHREIEPQLSIKKRVRRGIDQCFQCLAVWFWSVFIRLSRQTNEILPPCFSVKYLSSIFFCSQVVLHEKKLNFFNLKHLNKISPHYLVKYALCDRHIFTCWRPSRLCSEENGGWYSHL